MKKKIFVSFLIFVYFMILFTGCGHNNEVVNLVQSDDSGIRITFFGNKYEPENVEVIEEIISGFMKDNPGIRVSYESMKGNRYFEALEKRMAAGKGNDVFMVNHDTLLKLEKNKQVAELSELPAVQNYTSQMRSQMEENGKIYWVPTTVSVFGLYCNLDLLEKHQRKIPHTLLEWEETCDYFLEQGVTPIIANNDISLKTLAIGRGFYPIYQGKHQENVLDGLNRGEEKLSTYLEEGFRLVKKFIDKGYVNAEKTLAAQKTLDDLQEFGKGEAPFMLTGAWAAGRVENMNTGFDFEVVPLPVLEDGSLLVINADTRLSVNMDSEHLDAAMKFVEYFTQAENIHKFADQQASFCPLTGGHFSFAEAIQPLILDYESGRTVIGSDGRLELPIWTITAKASRMLLSGETLKTTMDWMDQQGKREGVEAR